MTLSWKSTGDLLDKIYPETGITAWGMSNAHRSLSLLRGMMPKPDGDAVGELTDVHLQNAWTWLLKNQYALNCTKHAVRVEQYAELKPFNVYVDLRFSALAWFLGYSEQELFKQLKITVMSGDLPEVICARIDEGMNAIFQFLRNLHGELPGGDFFDATIEHPEQHSRIDVLKFVLNAQTLFYFDPSWAYQNIKAMLEAKEPHWYGFKAIQVFLDYCLDFLFEKAEPSLDLAVLWESLPSVLDDAFLMRVLWVDQWYQRLANQYETKNSRSSPESNALKSAGLRKSFFCRMMLSGVPFESLEAWFCCLVDNFSASYSLPSSGNLLEFWALSLNSPSVSAFVNGVHVLRAASWSSDKALTHRRASRAVLETVPGSMIKAELVEKSAEVGAAELVDSQLDEVNVEAVLSLSKQIRPEDSGLWQFYLWAQDELCAFGSLMRAFMKTEHWPVFCDFMRELGSRERVSQMVLAISWLAPSRFTRKDLIQPGSFLVLATDPRAAALKTVFGEVIDSMTDEELETLYTIIMPGPIDQSRILIEQFLAERYPLAIGRFFNQFKMLSLMNSNVSARQTAFEFFQFFEAFLSPGLHPSAARIFRNSSLFLQIAGFYAGPAVMKFNTQALREELGGMANDLLRLPPVALPFLNQHGVAVSGSSAGVCAGAGGV